MLNTLDGPRRRGSGEELAGYRAWAMWITVVSTTVVCDFSALAAATRGVERLLTSPAETAARERLNRGLYAFERQWFDEALEEFQAAIDGFPYWSDAQTLLGVTMVLAGDDSAATAAFGRAVRYAERAPAVDRWGATAAILFAGAPGETQASKLKIVRQADELTGELCLELAWIRLGLGDESESLEARLIDSARTQVDDLPGDALAWIRERHSVEPISVPNRQLRQLSSGDVRMHEDRITSARTEKERARFQEMYERARWGYLPGAQPLRPYLEIVALVQDSST